MPPAHRGRINGNRPTILDKKGTTMALNITPANKPVVPRATVDPDVVEAVQASWDAGVGSGNEPAGFTVPIAELDADGDCDKAVSLLRRAGNQLGVGLICRRDGESVWFAAKVRATRK